MADKNVYVTRVIPERGLELLRAAPEIGRLDINPDDRALTRAEVLEQIADRDAVLCLLTERIDDEVFATADRAVVFANYAVGFNNIDVPAATRHGVLVTNTPGVLTDASATHAWALLLTMTRRIVEGDRMMREGRYEGWGPMMLLGGDVTGATLGLVGCGRIATEVAKRAVGFRMRILYTDPVRNPTVDELGGEQVELDELLQRSDFVSVHALLNEDTRHLIGARELGLMKPTAYLINTARGPLLDEAALVEVLRERAITGAGLDVYEDEPAMAPGLAELDNVVLAPHTASATLETRSRMAELAATNLLAGLRGERPPNLLNPEAWEQRRRG